MLVKHNPKLRDPLDEYTFKIVSSGDALCGNEWHAREISPPYTRLYYMLEGEGEIKSAEGVTLIKEGNLYIIPAGYSFSYSCANKMRQLYFHINLISSGGYDLIRGVNKILSLKVEPSYMKNLCDLYFSEEKIHHTLLKSLLQKDLFSAFDASGISFGVSEPSDTIKYALRYIEEHLSMSLTISEISEKLFISPDALSHRFKKEMGEPVGKYIDGLIFYRAEQLLAGSELPLSQISAELGFYDQFYFSHRFKEKFGIPPLKYRKIHKQTPKFSL